jgi:hypothetical protein
MNIIRLNMHNKDCISASEQENGRQGEKSRTGTGPIDTS